MRTWIVLGIAALAGCGSNASGSGDDGTTVTCGTGTTLVGDTCEAGSGSGSDTGTTCGSGTMLSGTTCVPASAGATGAPTISMIDPQEAGFTGFVLFNITGTGFAGSDVSGLTVFFGDPTNMDCQAEVGNATATTITGEVPPACDLSVVVTVTTNKGSATTPFQYDALFAADGDGGGGVQGLGGDLYVIDPSAGLSVDFGPLMDAGSNAYGLNGLAFSSTGTLYGVTTGDSPGDTAGDAQLVTIDPATDTVTVIGNLVDATGNLYYPTDIKMSGTTLYGWSVQYAAPRSGSTTPTMKQELVSINTTTAVVTKVGTAATTKLGLAGLAIDGTGNMFVAANGAGSDVSVAKGGDATTGVFDSVNTTTGVLTASTVALDYPFGAPIEAMEYFGTNLLAVVDNGTYGTIISADSKTAAPPTLFGEQLALIDTTATQVVSPLFELPAQVGAQSHVDALALAPAGLSLAGRLVHATPTALAPASTVAHP